MALLQPCVVFYVININIRNHAHNGPNNPSKVGLERSHKVELSTLQHGCITSQIRKSCELLNR